MGAAILITLLIIIGFIVIMFTWVMAAPFVFYLNTDMQLAYAKIPGLAKAEVTWVNVEPKVVLSLLFFNIPLPKTAKKQVVKPRKKIKINIKPSVALKYTKAIFRSFHVKTFRLKLDTGDYLLNAWLYPVFCMLRNDERTSQSINFDGVMSLEMRVTNRMGRVAWLGLKMWREMRVIK